VRISVAYVLAQLRAERLATDGVDALARAALQEELRDYLPWYLRTAIGLGAWLATGFFLGFLLLFVEIDDAIPRILAGLVLSALAVWQRREATLEFVRHAAVAAALAGFGLLIAGLYDLIDARATGVVVALLAAVLIRIMPDIAFRFLATLALVTAIYVSIVDERSARGYELVTLLVIALTALVWRYRLRDRSSDVERMLQPVGYGLVVALFIVVLVGTSTKLGRLSFDSGRWLVVGGVTTIGMTAALLALVWTIVDEHGGTATSPSSMAALLGVVALGAATMTSPGVMAGAAVLTLAFDRRDTVLLGMAVAFLLVFGAAYYYALHLTLLEKAGVLAGSGILLLAVRHRLARA
jgi:hypothetical protein